MDEIDRIVAAAIADFGSCADPAALENSKAKYLGKAGALTDQLKALGKLDAKERPAAGARINAAARELGMSYSVFMNGLKKASIDIDRKVLADLAVHDKAAFTKIAEQAKASLA